MIFETKLNIGDIGFFVERNLIRKAIVKEIDIKVDEEGIGIIFKTNAGAYKEKNSFTTEDEAQSKAMSNISVISCLPGEK